MRLGFIRLIRNSFFKEYCSGNTEDAHICTIVNLKTNRKEAYDISKQLINYINNSKNLSIKFKYEYRKNTAMFVLSGNPFAVKDLVNMIPR